MNKKDIKVIFGEYTENIELIKKDSDNAYVNCVTVKPEYIATYPYTLVAPSLVEEIVERVIRGDGDINIDVLDYLTVTSRKEEIKFYSFKGTLDDVDSNIKDNFNENNCETVIIKIASSKPLNLSSVDILLTSIRSNINVDTQFIYGTLFLDADYICVDIIC